LRSLLYTHSQFLCSFATFKLVTLSVRHPRRVPSLLDCCWTMLFAQPVLAVVTALSLSVFYSSFNTQSYIFAVVNCAKPFWRGRPITLFETPSGVLKVLGGKHLKQAMKLGYWVTKCAVLKLYNFLATDGLNLQCSAVGRVEPRLNWSKSDSYVWHKEHIVGAIWLP